MAEPGSVNFERQKEIIKDLLDNPLVDGAAWFVVDAKWFKKWKTFVGYDEWGSSSSSVPDELSHPGPIDNSGILNDGTDILKGHLIADMDFSVVPREAWMKLVEWYSLADGQTPIERRVIKQGLSQLCRVEVYLIDVKLCHGSDTEHSVVKYFSCVNTLNDVVLAMRREFNIAEGVPVVLKSQYLPGTSETLNKLDSTLEEAGIGNGHLLVIEEKSVSASQSNLAGRNTELTSNSRNSFNISSSSSSGFSEGLNYGSYSNSSLRDGVHAGLCGLSNLGNTCFMNSALQCMSNVPRLTEYMLLNRWKEELNTKNPLGMRGEIATTYAALIQTMWSGKHTCAVPRNFKVAVGRFKPEFSGYQQQDSQELMAFLLDGLHEDLNRIHNKPYVEVKEADNRPDEEVAKETWRDYRLRNDSIIVDIFHGLLKSTLVCPECSKVSVKFDPFCYLSLPLPVKKERQITVFFVSLRPNTRIRQCKVTVPKMGCTQDLCAAVAALVGVPHDKLVVVDIYNHRFHKVFTLNESLTHITDRDDIYVFQVPINDANDPDTAIIPVYMREVTEKRGFYSSSYTQLFGMPILVPIPKKNCSYAVLYQHVHAYLLRYIRSPSDDDSDAAGSSSKSGSNVSASRREEDDQPEQDVEKENEDSSGGASGTDNTLNERLFTLCIINSYGSTEVDQIADDGQHLSQLFEGQLYLSADWTTKNKQKYYDESEAKLYEVDSSMDSVTPSKKQTILLTDCLDLFTTKEKLGEHDLWFCPACKRHQQATKKFDIWELPHILVIHLKRFSYNRYWRDKLDTFIDYPVSGLDMSRFVIKPHHPPAIYDLIAVSNHYGGLGGGHYTAFARNARRDQWFHFDDSSVSSVTEDSVVTKAGYVLVYQCRRPANVTPDSGIIADGGTGSSATAMDV